MKTLKIFFPVLFMVMAYGCATGKVQERFVPSTGAYSFTNASGVNAVSESEVDVKTGESSSFSVLGLVSIGNSGSATAARNGGIYTIKTSQMDIMKIKLFGLPIYTKYTTTVTGN